MSDADKKFEGLACSKEELIEKLRETINLENYAVTPIFSEVWKRVHPAIDVVDGVAYVGVDLPCEVTDDEGKTQLKEFHFLIGSDKSRVLCHKEELAKRRIKLAHSVVRLPNRWSLGSVKAWLDGVAKVEPDELYIAIKTAFETYVEFEDSENYDFLTLWTIGTYFFHLFHSYPYLYIGGMKQVGKTKLLTVLSLLCHNALFSNDLTVAGAFRSIQSGRCTLLMDDTEKLANPERHESFRSLLFSGYKKSGVTIRCKEKTNVPELYEVYSPKAIANITRVEDVLEDRCITIIMKRGKNLDIVNAEVPLNSPVWQQIRDMLYIFYLSYFNELTEHIELTAPTRETLKQRELELWKPILTLAQFFNRYFPGLYERIYEFALKKAGEKLVENLTETSDFILVQTLVSLVSQDGYYKVKDIRDAMAENFDEEQKWLTTKWVGNALRRLGFTDKKRRKSYEYLLTKEKVEDLALRLGISKTLSPVDAVNSVSSASASIPEIYDILRRQLTEPFYDHRAIELIRTLRQCSYEEAEKLFQIFKDEGKIFQNSFGLWEWVR